MDLSDRKNFVKGVQISKETEPEGRRLHVQKRKIAGLGLVSRQIEYNVQNAIAYAKPWATSRMNQIPWQQQERNELDIESWMKWQDNRPELEKKKYKDEAIKRWVFSQYKYLEQRSKELPFDELIPDEDETIEKSADTTCCLASQGNQLNGRWPLRQVNSSFDALKLSGNQPKKTYTN